MSDTQQFFEVKQSDTGDKTNPEYVKYGTKDGQLEFGHLHLAGANGLNSDVKSGVMLQAHDSLHYMTMDNDGPRAGWTLNRSPGPYQIDCASKYAGDFSNTEKGVGFFLLSENGDIVISAPKGRIRLSALSVDIICDGPDNTLGAINLESNESVNIKTKTISFDAHAGIKIMTNNTCQIIANGTLELASNFVNGLSAASRLKPNKDEMTSSLKFNLNSNYIPGG